jgi:acetate kinase
VSAILTLNAGSSSIKFSVYTAGTDPSLVAVGQVESLGSPTAALSLTVDGTKTRAEIGPAQHGEGVKAILTALAPVLHGAEVVAVGHRIVHGGTIYDRPQVLDAQVMQVLDQFVPLAPLHQPHNLAAVRAAIAAFPAALQVGCFDTAFHRGHPWVNDTFALPRRFYDMGIRRYGFHGLSYEYISGELRRTDPEAARGRVVVAHLGNGASMCGILDGRSIVSTMGFTALDGLPMGTRCGQLDPGVLLYLIQQKGYTVDELRQMLYNDCGLKGLSGLSNDMRALERADTEEANQAIDYFVTRIRRELGAMAAVLGGLDTVVFCGGIGENSVRVRREVCTSMDWLGIALDPAANERGTGVISTGPVSVRVIPTDEELVIARAVNSRL